MSVSEDVRHRLSLWCAERIPEAERARRQIAYSVDGGQVTIVDRRAPAEPELGAEWSSTPLARLHVDGSGWTLHRPAGARWEPHASGEDPIALLDAVT